ncbi:MAG: hypothetical protein IPJ74_13225 [Saprospiraceae bacterium]|nr:hypothetical protein [Saprospiraceae bacterium]
MFLKIQHGKKLIEGFGRLHFHRYINDLIYEITEVIINRKGEIYEYVDEEIVLVWKLNTGIENANCIRTYFEIKNKASAAKEYFYEKIPRYSRVFGFPSLRKGDSGRNWRAKSEIKYHGDAMNTASRILGLANKENNFIASKDIIQNLKMPVIYEASSFGVFDLKGKANKIDLFTIREKEII